MRDWLSHRARVSPETEAVIAAGDGTTHTYTDLAERVEGLAGRLATRGVGVDDHLGVVLETSTEFVVLVHAAMRIGAVLVPASPRLTARELADRIDRADVDLLVCGDDGANVARDAVARADGGEAVRNGGDDGAVGGGGGDGGGGGGGGGGGDGVGGGGGDGVGGGGGDGVGGGAGGPDVVTLSALDGTRPEPFDLPAWDLADTQLVVFTSGTTGRPKAVSLTTGNLFASACGSAFRLGVADDDRWHCCLRMDHVGGLAPVYRSVLYGTSIVVQEGFDAEPVLAAMREAGTTCISLVPTMLRRLLAAGDLPDSLRFVLLGGAPAPRDLLDRCRERDVPVWPTYGLTETASQVATARPAEAFANPGTVGRPLQFTDVSIVGQSGETRPPGEPGEIVVSGPTVSPGYYDDGSAGDRARGHDGLHTGDVGYRDEENRLYLLNRLDDRIITGGENVDPGEVVGVLRAHDDVLDAAVVGLDDPEWGQRVAALVVREGAGDGEADGDGDGDGEADGDGDVTRDELEAHFRERLAGFKCPRTVAFADELPRTASGTVDRGTVRKRLQEEYTGRQND